MFVLIVYLRIEKTKYQVLENSVWTIASSLIFFNFGDKFNNNKQFYKKCRLRGFEGHVHFDSYKRRALCRNLKKNSKI